MRNKLYNYIFSLLAFILFISIVKTQITEPTMVITAAEGLDGFSSTDATLSLTFTSSAITNDFTEDDITVNNGVISDFLSVQNRYLSFDGVDDYVKVKREVQDDFTLQAWVKTTTSSNGNKPWDGLPIVYADIGGGTNLDFCTAVLNGKFSFNTGFPDVTINSTSSIDDGQWHHVVATREKSTGTMSVYVDGVLENTQVTTNTGSLTLPSYIYIGGQDYNSKYYKGQIEEVAVWTSTISSDGVAALYNSGSPLNVLADVGGYTSSSNLQGYWKFNDQSGSTAEDASTSNNDGEILGPTWVDDESDGNVFTATLTPIAHGWVDIDVLANTFTDGSGNSNTAAEQFNWFYDIRAPEIVFDPLNGSVDVALNTNITLTFDEYSRHINNDEITDTSVDALLRLKTPTHNGTDIPFEATIDADKKVITIDPSDNFEYAQTIWVGIGESVEDSLNNTIFSAAAYFVTTDTNRAPVINTYTDQTTIEDVAINLVLAATDLDNDIISFAATSSEPNVTPLITDSLLTLTPALNWHGISTITVAATDNSATPLTREIRFKLTVLPVNDAPSAVTFSPDSIEENLYAGTFVGLIQALDPDTGETFVYDMISGDGVNDRDNDKFIITNDSLLSNAVFDYEEEDSLFIRLLVRDRGGLNSELNAIVKVIDTPDPILEFSTTTLTYGKVIITKSSEQTLTLSSTGTDTVMIDSISQLGASYIMSSETYPIKIAPDLTKDFTFNFSPVDTGSYFDQAIFYTKFIAGTNQVILDGRGVFDTIPPVIASLPVISSSEAQEVLLTVPVEDENLITNVTLNYIVGGDPTIHSQEATSNGDGTYSATIGTDFTSILGLAYYHTAEDEYSNIGISDTSSIEVKYVEGNLDSKISGTAYPNGIPKSKWRLISVPTNLNLKTVNETLGDELGEEGKYSWKLFEDLGNATWQEAQDIKLGKGYWLQQRQEEDLSFGVGSGKSVDIRSYTIRVPKGWSLIGNPYPFPIKVYFDDAEVFGPLTYSKNTINDLEGWDAETTTLSPWEGYAVYNRTSDSLGLELKPLDQGNVQSAVATDGWHIDLSVDNGTYSDQYNRIGRRLDASDKLDQWDNPEPPKLEQYLSLSMDREEWDLELPLTSDIRSMNETNGQWDMYLDTKGIKGTVYLETNIKGDFPLESHAVLFDPIERNSYDLLAGQTIMITRQSDHYNYPLNILVGSPDYVLAKTEELIAQLPESFTLGQNYPNPFNPETNIPFTVALPSYVQISIYNLLGQKVVSLESRWFDMGQYNVRWNGKDAQGNQLSTGVYIYSLESPEFRKAKKLILVK